MDSEEQLLEALSPEADGEAELPPSPRRRKRRHASKDKTATLVEKFLGSGKQATSAAILPRYYGELLAWAVSCYVRREAWQVNKELGYRYHEPVFAEITFDYGISERLIRNGQLLVSKGKMRLLITLDINNVSSNVVLVEGPAKFQEQIKEFAEGIMTIAKNENFYRGKKFEFSFLLRLLNVKTRTWESVVLDAAIKNDIRVNTIDFLEKAEVWAKYGIPSRRGILLAGEPGTGKTIICKGLMAEARNITCITANAYDLCENGYIQELYEAAQDLSPCIVFIEDIDLVGQNRMEFGYHAGSSLVTLLAVLDGIEEKHAIATVATTNCLETLDKALSERPSRFDRVIQLERPNADEREQLIRLNCQRIPLSKEAQMEIARKTANFTPAQIQEVIHGLLIEHHDQLSGDESQKLALTLNQIDAAIAHISGMNRHPMGFIGNAQKVHRQDLNIQN